MSSDSRISFKRCACRLRNRHARMLISIVNHAAIGQCGAYSVAMRRCLGWGANPNLGIHCDIAMLGFASLPTHFPHTSRPPIPCFALSGMIAPCCQSSVLRTPMPVCS